MKVVVYEKMTSDGIDTKSKQIGEFDVNEPSYLELKKLGVLNDKRYPAKISFDNKNTPIFEGMEVNTEAFVDFYSKVLELAGLTEQDIVKYGFKYADTALEQIYLAWTTDEKKS